MEQPFQNRRPSPSHAAALLAHRRAASAHDITKMKSDRGSMLSAQHALLSRVGTGTREEGPREDSPRTQELVRLYESKKNTTRRTQSVRYVNKSGPPIRSPVPIRPLKPSITSTTFASDTTPTTSLTPAASAAARSNAFSAATTQTIQSTKDREHKAVNRQASKILLPTKEDRDETREEAASARASTGAKDDTLSSEFAQETSTIGPRSNAPSSEFLPTRSFSTRPSLQSLSSTSVERLSKTGSNQTQPLSSRPSMDSSRGVERSDQTGPLARKSENTTGSISRHMSVDSLANAIVASSLASSRAPSPRKPSPMAMPPTLPPPSHQLHLFHRNRSQEQIPRTPSPAKAMRHTMRAPTVSEDDETDHRHKGRSHLVRKHPNKHHEGDRKRYRTQVTERERRRYEGVWAANRGMFLATVPEEATASVLNLVTRDIWRRSRLPDDVLEEVWDLVNVRNLDRLNREEFVVGMWLIDQRLKGNKLPIKVSESVWSSVRRLQGIKIPKHK